MHPLHPPPRSTPGYSFRGYSCVVQATRAPLKFSDLGMQLGDFLSLFHGQMQKSIHSFTHTVTTPKGRKCLNSIKVMNIIYIPLTNRVRGPYRKLRTKFFPPRFMAQAPSTGHKSKGKKLGSVTYSTDRENEVSKIFIISLRCV